MRLRVFTLTGACLFLFLYPPAYGQTPSMQPCRDPQKPVEDKDPIAIVELGAATSWNVGGGVATFAPNRPVALLRAALARGLCGSVERVAVSKGFADVSV